MVYLVTAASQIFHKICRQKDIENQLIIFGEDMDKICGLLFWPTL